MNAINQLPDSVIEALQRGETIEAIKLLRSSTGLGLKEAKDTIDAYLQGNATPEFDSHFQSQSKSKSQSAVSLPDSVLEALLQGNKIEAIKRLREQTGLGLKEAKEAVERVGQATRPATSNYAPGEVPKSGSAVWAIVVAGIIAFAAYYFLFSGGK